MAAAAQLDHILDLAMDHQYIAGQQGEILLGSAVQVGAAVDLQHLQAAATVEIGLGNAFANHRRPLRHP